MKQQQCTYCHRLNHTSMNCFRKRLDKAKEDQSKRKKPIKTESTKTMQKRQITKATFFTLVKPDNEGKYDCWLKIHPMCPQKLPKHYVTAEHVYPKAKCPELKYVPENILPSCEFCNKMKLNNTPEQLAIYFPNIKALLLTPWWAEFKETLNAAIKARNIELYWSEELNKYVRYQAVQNV